MVKNLASFIVGYKLECFNRNELQSERRKKWERYRNTDKREKKTERIMWKKINVWI